VAAAVVVTPKQAMRLAALAVHLGVQQQAWRLSYLQVSQRVILSALLSVQVVLGGQIILGLVLAQYLVVMEGLLP
tara:strand:- start:474 stop:698 length:225 start_codon:yes stop_codon:yes gene_type:complete